MKTHKNTTSKRLLLFFTILPMLLSCRNFLEIDPPKTELATATVYQNNSTANAAVTSIYANMINTSSFANIHWLTSLSSDEFTNYSTDQNIISFYSNALASTNPTVKSALWDTGYSYIYRANDVIEGLETYNGVREDLKTQLRGEAKFIRAFWHFYLTCFFGDIPLLTSTDYRANAVKARSAKELVLQQVLNDLLEAKTMLNDNYLGPDGLTTTNERVRPNKAAAEALLARVYLYMKNYDLAEKEATLIIENSAYNLPSDLRSVFLKNSTEAIWQLQPVSGNATPEAQKFLLKGAPETIIDRTTALTPQLLGLFQDTDNRKTNWTSSLVVAGKTYAFPFKYKINGTNNTEYSMVLRLAEQYLIRAEARIQLNKTEMGLGDINALRVRANIKPYLTDTVTNAMALVELERQRELFTEGHRWFDLARTDRANTVMTIVTHLKGGVWKSTSVLYPIPELERSNNTNLTQNNGY